jgi:multiple sugar transport system substrate-binding protein
MNGKRVSRRSFIRGGAGALLGLGALAACAPATPSVVEKVVEKEVTVEVTKVVVEKPVEIIWTSWATDTFGMFRCEEQVNRFRQKYPDIIVHIRNVGAGYRERLLTALAGGVGPDVYRICSEDELAFYKDGQCEQLDPWFEKQKDSWFWTDDPKREIIDGHRIDGKLWFYPMALDLQAFTINKSLFQESGVALPPMSYRSPEYKSDWTYEKFLETAKALTKYAPDGTPIQFGTNVYAYYYLYNVTVSKAGRFWLSEDGSQFLGTDSDIVDAIQWFADIRLVHKAAPTPEQEKGGAFDYANGRLALAWSFIGWLCYGERNVGDRFDWDVAPLPHWGGGDPGLYHEPCVWVFNPHSKQKEATWTFFHWLVGPEGVEITTELAWELPIYRSVEPLYGKRIPAGKNLTLGPESVDIGRADYFWLKNLNFYEAWTVVEAALDEVLLGIKTAKEAMAEIKPEVDRILKEGKEAMAKPA